MPRRGGCCRQRLGRHPKPGTFRHSDPLPRLRLCALCVLCGKRPAEVLVVGSCWQSRGGSLRFEAPTARRSDLRLRRRKPSFKFPVQRRVLLAAAFFEVYNGGKPLYFMRMTKLQAGMIGAMAVALSIPFAMQYRAKE